tara:strand:+ start:324 stop:779 length:456 start_codon:yes stop_codon:yes gene_type:complete
VVSWGYRNKKKATTHRTKVVCVVASMGEPWAWQSPLLREELDVVEDRQDHREGEQEATAEEERMEVLDLLDPPSLRSLDAFRNPFLEGNAHVLPFLREQQDREFQPRTLTRLNCRYTNIKYAICQYGGCCIFFGTNDEISTLKPPYIAKQA